MTPLFFSRLARRNRSLPMPQKRPPNRRHPISLFPGIYYFIPCLREEKRKVGNVEIKFDEPMDAMLWFLDEIPEFTGRRSHPKAALKKFTIRWFGEESTRNFERLYKQLRDKEFIHSEPDPTNRRAHNVEITASGRRLLNQVKAERTEHTELFRGEILKLRADERRVIRRWLHRIATSGMAQMVAEVGGESDLAVRQASGSRKPVATTDKRRTRSRRLRARHR